MKGGSITNNNRRPPMPSGLSLQRNGAANGGRFGLAHQGYNPPYRYGLPRQLTKQQNNSWVGPGLRNLGNTCYLNCILQVMIHCQEVWQEIKKQPHEDACPKDKAFCVLCEVEGLIKRARKPPQQQSHQYQYYQSEQKKALSPTAIASNIRRIAPHFSIHHQEDAHEFLRTLIDAMQRCCPPQPKGIDAILKPYPFSLFAGSLVSKVQCTECKNVSLTVDPMEDLVLEIHKEAWTLDDTLKRFTANEMLDGSNLYKCEKCSKAVRAVKSIRLREVPKVLAIQLKRFAHETYGKKITKKISFPDVLRLDNFISDGEQGQTVRGELFAVVVHSGHSVDAGHYYCYVKNASKGSWFEMNDESVTSVDKQTVMSCEAYILFYVVNQQELINRNNGNSNSQGQLGGGIVRGPTGAGVGKSPASSGKISASSSSAASSSSSSSSSCKSAGVPYGPAPPPMKHAPGFIGPLPPPLPTPPPPSSSSGGFIGPQLPSPAGPSRSQASGSSSSSSVGGQPPLCGLRNSSSSQVNASLPPSTQPPPLPPAPPPTLYLKLDPRPQGAENRPPTPTTRTKLSRWDSNVPLRSSSRQDGASSGSDREGGGSPAREGASTEPAVTLLSPGKKRKLGDGGDDKSRGRTEGEGGDSTTAAPPPPKRRKLEDIVRDLTSSALRVLTDAVQSEPSILDGAKQVLQEAGSDKLIHKTDMLDIKSIFGVLMEGQADPSDACTVAMHEALMGRMAQVPGSEEHRLALAAGCCNSEGQGT